MADIVEEMRDSLEEQIDELRKEMSRISRSIAEGAEDAIEEAADLYEQGRGRMRRTARGVGDQIHFAADVARENPVTTATVLSTVALLGLAAGLMLGGMFAGGSRR
ncbi:hypothetical protein G5B31_11330 [Rhodobacter sp. SGA-6-6]|uniref:hypothetical protein n=1 Tax=Rhodobacter sp. SGA-6-6 TaxID=2710882 RepID=UPI0013EB3175|nr:hypothetical protein [Rhodobacter sp. SGA-6-6]NGM46125.1 hypothetical protein [Rhodobacter sp. SGA-6-6]